MTDEVLDDYYSILNTYYEDFYRDAADRPATCWCIKEGYGEYLVRRHIKGKTILFPDSFDEAEPFLNLERICTIVPNSMPLTSPYPIEMILDLDTGNVPYSIVRKVMSCQYVKKIGKNAEKISERTEKFGMKFWGTF